MAFVGEDLQRLLQTLSKLPGLGTRSAKRLALHLLNHRDTALLALMENLQAVHASYVTCRICGYWDARTPCFFCTSPQRDDSILCVVEETSDVWVLEKAGIFKGRYHVLGSVSSTPHGRFPEQPSLESLLDRLDTKVHEVILALNSTVEGQTTLYYLMTELRENFPHLAISRLARGIPAGGELDYLDPGTLINAFVERKSLVEEFFTEP